MNVKTQKFGTLPNGREVGLYSLINDNKLTVKIINYGAIVTAIEMPDKKGTTENIVCGFNNLQGYLSEAYLKNYPYFGSIIGRYGNRIAKGHLEVEGKTYALAVNNGPNHLHGGNIGFDKRFWEARPFQSSGEVGVEMTYHSPHMEENYPGNLQVRCVYSLNNQNEFKIEYFAETDQTTVVNLTNHTYFNLTVGKENVMKHELKLAVTKMTEMSNQIPTGKIVSTTETPFDFSEFMPLDKYLSDLPGGYDDNFVLDNESSELKYAGTLREKSSGRQVEVYTTQPGLQLYTGYWIPELIVNGEKKFGSFSGVALETQHFPDSVHYPQFPSTLLLPGDTYHEITVYTFKTE
jgi:aldose 1-epimerase